MSTLQIGLAVAGGLVLAGVVAHGAWTSRKNAPKQATPEVTSGELALEGVEPTLDNAAFDSGEMRLPVLPRRPAMDALIDVIATVA